MDELWRFKSMILPYLDKQIKYFWQNPIEVLSDKSLIGFASLYISGDMLLADIAVLKALRERLDVEIGEKLYTLPNVTVTPASLISPNPHTVIQINSISLQYDCNDPNHEPIGGFLL